MHRDVLSRRDQAAQADAFAELGEDTDPVGVGRVGDSVEDLELVV